ncbi:putative poly variant [Phaeomoniella chlamydospora]|uniref:Putative poly variant n=1 Tax=Phaeomoniella chlamydospora TaxID=158046 RepID=A0A0G2GQG8_PHACM|nr:putative poly variant [Phaeomoniella chlamydospora]
MLASQSDSQNSIDPRPADPFVPPNGTIQSADVSSIQRNASSPSDPVSGTSTTVATERHGKPNAQPSNIGPLIIDGSKPMSRRRYPYEEINGNSSASVLEDRSSDAQSTSSSVRSDTQGFLPVNEGDIDPIAYPATQRDALGIIHGHPSPEAPKDTSHEWGSGLENQKSPVQMMQDTANKELNFVHERNAESVSPNEAGPISRAQALSPVKEVRTPSPTAGRNPSSTGSERFNPSGKTKPKSKQDKLSVPQNSADKIRSSALSQKINVPTVFEPSKSTTTNGQQQANGWQTATTKRKHKRAAKSTNDAALGNTNGGQFLPADEKLRKGG